MKGKEAFTTMADAATNNIRVSTDLPIKKCWCAGDNIVVTIDKKIVKRLGINEHSTYVQQEVTDDDRILLLVKQYVKEGKT
ncbi:MAG: hypothetical protein WCC17_23720 [Candidatus Nitrosopolaris sp.]